MVIKKLIDIFLLIVIVEGCCYATEYPKLQEITVDLGENVTLPCTDWSGESRSENLKPAMWVREGRADEQISRTLVGADGKLTLTHVEREDAGIYSCALESKRETSDDDFVFKTRIRVSVRTPPPALVNVTVHPSTVLALLLWDVADTGGHPITHFTARYRQRHPDSSRSEQWRSVMPEHISPNVRQIDVYRLEPNTTYVFRIWASNKLGAGEKTELEATTSHSMEEIELARHLLDGVQDFDTRVWVAAVAVVMGTLLMLAVGTCYLLYKECNIPSAQHEEQEGIELVPNIILNPGYLDEDQRMEERLEPDENCNDRTATRVNNNTVIRPFRV